MTSLPHEKQRKEVKEMNTLVIVLIAAVCLFGAYTLYGRWLANKWGIDPTAKTPAVVHEDGRGAAGGFVTVMVPDLLPADDEMRGLYTMECTSLNEVLAKLKTGEL